MQAMVTIASISAALVYAVLAVLSFVNGGLTKRSVFFALFMLVGVGWVLQTFLDVSTYELFVFMSRLIYVTFVLMFYFFLLFSLTLINITNKQFLLAGLAGLILVIASSLFTMLVPNQIIVSSPDLVFSPGGVIEGIEYDVVGMAFGSLLPALSFFIPAVIAQTMAMRQSRSARGKQIIRTILICSIVFIGFILIFNLFFATVHEAHWVGPLSILIVGFAFYGSAVKHADDDLS